MRREQPDTVVLINPNNPDGGYIPYATLIRLLEELRHVPNVIVDESFIHFACEGDDYAYRSLAGEIDRFPNLMVVKSMSKDFGVAGIRAGYAVMAPDRVRSLLDNGFLWNSSGLAEYFFDLYSRPDFLIEYERKRVHYIRHSRRFFRALSMIPGPLRLPHQRQLHPGRAAQRHDRRRPRLPPARPPRNLHPHLRRQEGPRARQVPPRRLPLPLREPLRPPGVSRHHAVKKAGRGTSDREPVVTTAFVFAECGNTAARARLRLRGLP